MIQKTKAQTLLRAFAWLAFAFLNVVSLIPVPEIVDQNFNDLFLHVVAYGGVMWSFTQGYPESKSWQWMVGLAIWGVMLEMVQGMTSFRFFEWLDIVANTTGVIFGWVLSLCHRPVLEKFQLKTLAK